jgi:hypothetical protein
MARAIPISHDHLKSQVEALKISLCLLSRTANDLLIDQLARIQNYMHLLGNDSMASVRDSPTAIPDASTSCTKRHRDSELLQAILDVFVESSGRIIGRVTPVEVYLYIETFESLHLLDQGVGREHVVVAEHMQILDGLDSSGGRSSQIAAQNSRSGGAAESVDRDRCQGCFAVGEATNSKKGKVEVLADRYMAVEGAEYFQST